MESLQSFASCLQSKPPSAPLKRIILTCAKGQTVGSPRFPKQLAAAAMSGSYALRSANFNETASPLRESARTTLQNPEPQRLLEDQAGASNRNGAARTLRAQKQLTRTATPADTVRSHVSRSGPIRRTNTTLKAKKREAIRAENV